MRKFKLSRVFTYVFLIIAFIASAFPFYWIVVGMTNTSADVIMGKMTFGNQIVNNFKLLLSQYNLGQILLNSVIVTGFTVLGILIFASMAAYGFTMYKSHVREKVYGTMLLAMMIPFAALLIPLFKLVVKLGMLNSFEGLVLTSLTSIFIMFFFRQSFRSYPYEVIQAARVDGAGELLIFFRIFVPSMKSTYAAAAIYAFMTSWNAYLWPLIVLQTDNKKTLTLMISSMSSSYTPQYGSLMAAIVVATLPTIIVFFSLQKYFVQGMLGSVKQ